MYGWISVRTIEFLLITLPIQKFDLFHVIKNQPSTIFNN
jgi:hypothetical protein